MITQDSFIKTLVDFLDILSDKQRQVVEKRFGLIGQRPMTLEAIGRERGVTRERIRQIEAGALDVLRKNIRDLGNMVERLKEQVDVLGGVRKEVKLLEEAAYSFVDEPARLAKREDDKQAVKNHVLLLLDLSPYFDYLFDKPERHSAWYSDKEGLKKMDSVHRFCEKELIRAKRTLQLDEYQELLRKVMKEFKIKNENVVNSYMDVSKKFGFNPFYEFGLTAWPVISPSSVSTKAYLILEKKGEPMHFSQIADAINEVNFNDGKEARANTVHNELIKSPDFILVGRGLYALKDWGYDAGTVKDLLAKFLKKGAKTFKELTDEIKKQRDVKDATIMINLQDKNLFKRLENGKYALNK